jgi:uncharacterized protein (TIGR02231 family)
MPTPLLFLLLGLPLALVPAAARSAGSAQPGVPAPITAVTLYPGSATITRTAQVAAGSTSVLITDVTSNFDVHTLRVESDPGIRVAQVQTVDAARTESTNPAQASVEAQLQALVDEDAALDAQANAADIVKGYLERLGAPADAATPRPAPDAKSLGALLDVIAHSAGETLATKQHISVQKRELEKKIAALQRDLARLRGEGRDSRSLAVHLTADRAGTLRLSYQVNSAGWKPSYRAELESAKSTVVLARRAQVSQKTGEDWKDVKIVLSTSQSRRSPLAPVPQPWLLSYQPPVSIAAKSMRQSSMALAAAPSAGAALAPAERPEPIPYEAPTFETDNAFATEFAVPGLVTLPADGRQVALELNEQTVTVRQRLQVTPQIDQAATLTAEAPRPEGVWLAGDLQIYRDGNYVGAANWNPQASDKLALSFGRDDLLRVSVEPVKADSGSTGVFEKRRQRRIADVITLRSAHTGPVDVLLLEASPVSTSDEIRVQSAFDPKPTIDPWEQKRGVVAWEKTLRPGEAAHFGVTYTIEFPVDGSVSGLR